MADLVLRAQRRAVIGKKVRFLRRQGLLPGSLYGPGVASVPLQFSAREADAVLRRATATTLLPLHVDDGPARRVLVREVQRHPVSEQALHVDLFAISMTETTRAEVPLHFVGEAPAVTQLDGTLVRSLESVEVEALPTDLPARLDIDLSTIVDLHTVVHASDLVLPPGVILLTPLDAALVTVVPPRVETEAALEAAAEAEPAAETPAATAEAEPATDESASEEGTPS